MSRRCSAFVAVLVSMSCVVIPHSARAGYVLEFSTPPGTQFEPYSPYGDLYFSYPYDRLDMDGDGIPELIVKDVGAPYLWHFYDGATHVEKWSYPAYGANILGFFDIDNDGIRELVVADWNQLVSVIDWHTDMVEFTLIINQVLILDIDTDGLPELLAEIPSPELHVEVWGAGNLSGVSLELQDSRIVDLEIRCRPNPTKGGLTIDFRTSVRGDTAISLFDSAGRCVRSWTEVAASPGTNSLFWDGCDEHANPLPSGMYQCRLQGGSGRIRTAPVVLLR